jgi:hypothetical protein
MKSSLQQVLAIVQSEQEQINYSKAFALLEQLQSRKGSFSTIFDSFQKIAVSGDRDIRLNCIALIDFLFKNGNKELLIRLQQSPVLLAIGNDPIICDPYVHHTLCDKVNSWVAALSTTGAVHPQLMELQRRICSFEYEYVLTPELSSKFLSDFSEVFEMLTIFNERLVTSFLEGIGAEDPWLRAVVPKLSELERRLKELKPTITDPYLVHVIAYLEEYCELCKASYSSLVADGAFDIDVLAEMAGKGIPQQIDQTSADLIDFGEKQQTVESPNASAIELDDEDLH